MRGPAEIIEREEDLDDLTGEWDRLAHVCASPYSSPAWMLAWWRHARPKGARLRVVAVRDGERLVGLAPLWLDGREHRLLAGRLSAPATPLAEPGRETDVAAAVGAALTDSGATTVRLEGQRQPGWAETLAGGWPGGRPWVHKTPPVVCPQVALDAEDYDGWLRSKSSNFRSQARRGRRKLEQAGARFSVAEDDGVERACAAFATLHAARWQSRGGSKALVRGLEAMLADAARELAPSGRFRAVVLEAGAEIVSAQLFVAAGGTVCYWNGGFDESWQRFAPAFQTLLFAIEDAIGRGDATLDLGPGAHPYKSRLADSAEQLCSATLVPRGRSYALNRARVLPYQARWGVSRRLSPDAKARLRGLLRR